MNKIMKFENTAIEIHVINGVPMFELYSVGMALGYTKTAKGKVYPFKNRIDKVAENAEISAVVHGVQPYITESQLYDFMLEARTDKCRSFRKWLTNEVLPELNHTGSYSMPKQDKQLEFYDYFDKTYKGEPVLSSMDVSHFTGLNYTVVDWYARAYLNKGKDFHCLSGEDLRSYKLENLKVSRFASAMNIFTKSGFEKICRHYGIEIETPKLFIEEKKVLPVKKNNEYEQVDMDDYITTLKTLRAVRKNSLNILPKNQIEAFDTCVHYICMNATVSSI